MHVLRPAADDDRRISLLLVDLQNSFCTPGFELFVGGRTGNAAVEDTRRLCEFIYRNLGAITRVFATFDSHRPLQIFHPSFWVDREDRHPAPFTLITEEDIERSRWVVTPGVPDALGIVPEQLNLYVRHYVRTLAERGKYDLMIWPYHALLGSPGHSLVSSVHEAVFFHSIARHAQPRIHIKGDAPLTEHYSIFGPEVTVGPDGEPIGAKNVDLIEELLDSEIVVIAGQAKSHCLAWTIDDLLTDIEIRNRRLAEKVYLLGDCTSPVVIPSSVDYTEAADAAFRRFEAGGMNVVRSTDPLHRWPSAGG